MRPKVEYSLNMPERTFFVLSFNPPSGRQSVTFSMVTFFSIIKSADERFNV